MQSRFFALVRQAISHLPDGHPYHCATFAVPNGFMRSKAMRIRGWQEGLLAGVLDVVVAVPRAPYAGLFMEGKVGRNTLSPEQRKFWKAMEALGYRCVEFRTAEEGFAVWCEHLGLKLSTAKG